MIVGNETLPVTYEARRPQALSFWHFYGTNGEVLSLPDREGVLAGNHKYSTPGRHIQYFSNNPLGVEMPDHDTLLYTCTHQVPSENQQIIDSEK